MKCLFQQSRDGAAVGSCDFNSQGSDAARVLGSMVLLLLVLFNPVAQGQDLGVVQLDGEVDKAIDGGVRALLDRQNRDGSWSPSNFQASPHWDHRNATTSFVLYTLLKCGVVADHPAVRRAASYLLDGYPTKTYSIATQLMALAELDGVAHLDRIEELAEALLDLRGNGPKNWMYPGLPGELGDLSNTIYAALGLRAAKDAGVKLPKKVWTEIAKAAMQRLGPEELLESGEEVRGFVYSTGKKPSSSMTATGLSLLYLALEAQGGKIAGETKRIKLAIEQSMAWLTSPFQVDGNRGDTSAWHYYYLYGLERAGSLSGLAEFNGNDWYRIGAEFLVGSQGTDGSWRTAGASTESWPPAPMIAANTFFALLFLKRASVSSGKSSKSLRVTQVEAGPIHFRVTKGQALTLTLSGFDDELVKRFAGDSNGTDGIRVSEVRWLVDGEPVSTLPGEPARAWNRERYAARYDAQQNGARVFAVEVDVLREGEEPGSAGVETLRSMDVTVALTAVMEPWMETYSTFATRNPFSGTKIDAAASSSLSARWSAGDAVDGLQFSGWVCRAGDLDPTLTLMPDRPAKANVLWISPFEQTEASRGAYAAPKRLEIQINQQREPMLVDVVPGSSRKTEVLLPKAVRLRKVVIRILETVDGDPSTRTTGLAEIEAELRK